MIYTVTLNGAIDYHMNCPGEIQRWQRLGEYDTLASGKGVNASLLLKNLGVPTTPLVVTGGPTGVAYGLMLAKDFKTGRTFDCGADTRINVKVNAGGLTHELNVTGKKPTSKKFIKEIAAYLTKNLKKDDLVAVMGSMPLGIVAKDIAPIVKAVKDKGCEIALDMSGATILDYLPQRPVLVKPNDKELGELFDVKIQTQEDIVKYGRRLLDLGAKRVIVSLGDKGAIYIGPDQVLRTDGLKVKEVNSAGAGDCVVGGFLAGMAKKLDDRDCFLTAVASATAKVAQRWFPTKRDVEAVAGKIQIKEWKQ